MHGIADSRPLFTSCVSAGLLMILDVEQASKLDIIYTVLWFEVKCCEG